MLMEVAARLAGTFLRWNPGRQTLSSASGPPRTLQFVLLSSWKNMTLR